VIEAIAMDDTMRRCILAMLLVLTSGLPLMLAGPLRAGEPAPGPMIEHQIAGLCPQMQRGMCSVR
jgi:hypothetical protein